MLAERCDGTSPHCVHFQVSRDHERRGRLVGLFQDANVRRQGAIPAGVAGLPTCESDPLVELHLGGLARELVMTNCAAVDAQRLALLRDRHLRWCSSGSSRTSSRSWCTVLNSFRASSCITAGSGSTPRHEVAPGHQRHHVIGCRVLAMGVKSLNKGHGLPDVHVLGGSQPGARLCLGHLRRISGPFP